MQACTVPAGSEARKRPSATRGRKSKCFFKMLPPSVPVTKIASPIAAPSRSNGRSAKPVSASVEEKNRGAGADATSPPESSISDSAQASATPRRNSSSQRAETSPLMTNASTASLGVPPVAAMSLTLRRTSFFPASRGETRSSKCFEKITLSVVTSRERRVPAGIFSGTAGSTAQSSPMPRGAGGETFANARRMFPMIRDSPSAPTVSSEFSLNGKNISGKNRPKRGFRQSKFSAGTRIFSGVF